MNTETVTQAAVIPTAEAGQSAPATEAGQQPAAEVVEGGQVAQPEAGESEGTDEGQQNREPRKRPRWSDVNSARREADAARREADEWRRRATGQQSTDLPQQPQPATSAKPSLEEFDFDQDRYEDAVFEWRLAQRETKTEQTKAQQQAQQAHERFQDAAEDFAASHVDYEDVVLDPNLRITPVMAGAVHESEIGPQIAYHLGKNPAEAARIAALPPLSQAREIGRIESRLTAEGAKARPPKPIKTTNAPPPPPSVNSTAPVKKQEGDLSDEERLAAIRAAR